MVVGLPEETENNIEKTAEKIREAKKAEHIPDVCDTPSPGEPIPIPYPNIGMSSDTPSGSKTVKVEGGEAMVKESVFQKSTGDEPGQSDSIVDKAIDTVKTTKLLRVPLWIWGFSVIALIVIIWFLTLNAPQPTEPIEHQAMSFITSLP